MTYGLFSTCEPQMRNRIVRDGHGTMFFVTSHGRRPRAVAGYYRIGWYTEGTRGAANNDWALAASSCRWVDPVPLTAVAQAIPAAMGWFRTCKPTDAEATAEVTRLLDALPDRTGRYLAELARLERFARARTGYAYPSWGRRDGFSWADAPGYYRTDGAAAAPNSSPTRLWACGGCHRVITHGALLKRCPICGEFGSLTPHDPEETP